MTTPNFPELPDGFRFYVDETNFYRPRKLTPEQEVEIAESKNPTHRDRMLRELVQGLNVTIQERYTYEVNNFVKRGFWSGTRILKTVEKEGWRVYVMGENIANEDATPEALAALGEKVLLQFEERLEKNRVKKYVQSLIGAYPPLKLEDHNDRP